MHQVQQFRSGQGGQCTKIYQPYDTPVSWLVATAPPCSNVLELSQSDTSDQQTPAHGPNMARKGISVGPHDPSPKEIS